MHVVASRYALGVPQADGRVWVNETHTISDGSVRELEYLAAQGTDYIAVIAAHVNSLNEAIMDSGS